ncbi:CBS domain-containing protein, partial [Candidatus Latescibacterota bacterium]
LVVSGTFTLSAIIILVELTNNYGIILPLMLTVVIATFVSRKLSRESIYTRKLARKGIQVHMGEDLNILRTVVVKDIVRHDEPVISETATVEELINIALSTHRSAIFMVDSTGTYKGLITQQGLTHVLSNQEKLKKHSTVSELTEEAPAVREDQTLDTVLTIFGETGFDRLPVVNREGILVGSVIISDLIRQYNTEVTNRNIAIELGAVVHDKERSGSIQLGRNTIVTEVPVPAWTVGKSIGGIGLRSNFKVSVFLVKEFEKDGEPRFITPGNSYVFKKGDMLLIGGRRDDIDRFIQ